MDWSIQEILTHSSAVDFIQRLSMWACLLPVLTGRCVEVSRDRRTLLILFIQIFHHVRSRKPVNTHSSSSD